MEERKGRGREREGVSEQVSDREEGATEGGKEGIQRLITLEK